MVTFAPSEKVAPWAGDVLGEVGGGVSADAVSGVSPDINVAGCAPISASRFTVACCMVESTGPPPLPPPVPLSSPHEYWMVPAPNTRAPLAARYNVRLWVAVLF